MPGELDTITVKGFRSLKSIEKFALRPINVLVGPNGSGKSNFVEAFALLHALRAGKLGEYTAKRGGADRILYFGSKVTREIELEAAFENGAFNYRVCLAPTEGDQFYVSDESCRLGLNRDCERITGLGHEAGISLYQDSTAGMIQLELDRWRIHHFHDTSDSSPLKKTVDVDDNRYFRSDGSNLAAYLYFLRQRHETAYKLIRGAVQRVAPFFDDFQLAPLQLNESKIKLEWKHKASDRYFDASSLSDGTLRFICLATLLLQPRRLQPSLILVDEPELGLHPYAINLLGAMIRSASLHTQIIASTQSPLLLDQFEPEDVIVADLVDNATQLTRLQSDDLKAWLEDYSLGQLWEKNQFGGRPARV